MCELLRLMELLSKIVLGHSKRINCERWLWLLLDQSASHLSNLVRLRLFHRLQLSRTSYCRLKFLIEGDIHQLLQHAELPTDLQHDLRRQRSLRLQLRWRYPQHLES